jgi:hypothetical protein
LAFEDELGYDPSQPIDQNYALSATGMVSKTVSLWSRKIVQYILIVGVISAACVAVSVAILAVMFGLVGTIGSDPFSYVISFFMDPLSNLPLLTVSVGFAIIAFVLNAIIQGAAIKFTLDEYGGAGGDVGASFSHSFSRLLNIIIIQILIGFIVSIIFTPGTILATRALDMVDFTNPFNPIILPGALELMMASMVILLVGGLFMIYIQVRFLAAYAVVIDTDLSAIDSLKRSWELTSGNFFHVFVSYIVLVLAVAVLGLVVNVAMTFTYLPLAYTLIIESIVTALLFGALNYIFTVVLYRDLSSRTGDVSSSLDELML